MRRLPRIAWAALATHAAALACLVVAHLERGVSAETVFAQFDPDDETIGFPKDDEVLFENVAAMPWLVAAAVLLVIGTALLLRAASRPPQPPPAP